MDTPVSVTFCIDGLVDVVYKLAESNSLTISATEENGRQMARISGRARDVIDLLYWLKGATTPEVVVEMDDTVHRFSSFDQAHDFLRFVVREKVAEREEMEKRVAEEVRDKDEGWIAHTVGSLNKLDEMFDDIESDEVNTQDVADCVDAPAATAVPIDKEELADLATETFSGMYMESVSGGFLGGIVGGLIGSLRHLFTPKKSHQSDDDPDDVNAAVFSPAAVKAGSRMLVQVFLYLDAESSEVTRVAEEADKSAERRGYVPLDFPVERGETVTVQLSVDELNYFETRQVVWQGKLRKTDFLVATPALGPDDIFGEVTVIARGLPMGRMVFKTQVVGYKAPKLNAEVTSSAFQRVFISYAHADEDKVKYLIEGYRSLGRDIEFFYDRQSLRPGDEYPSKILEYIDKADLFVLCWSRNAADSQWVGLERARALERYRRECGAHLKLYPVNIQPIADIPEDMQDTFHFGFVN